MDELVKRLSSGKHAVVANHPDKDFESLKRRIELKYLHILFENTDTELGIKLNMDECDFSDCDLEAGKGTAYFVGGVRLNYERVKCVAQIDIENLKGDGQLICVEEKEYEQLMAN